VGKSLIAMRGLHAKLIGEKRVAARIFATTPGGKK
jgi:hypothetical protein